MTSHLPFEQVWDLLNRELASPTAIVNWTVYSGELKRGNFTGQAIGDEVICVLISGSKIHVPRGDFKTVYEMWPQYLSEEVPRPAIVAVTRHSKSVISILRQILGGS